MTDPTACTTVAKGGVGESGASSFLAHTVSGPTSKIMILRNVDTSLCPNTGAVAVLIVNGVPAVSGKITAKGSSIQTEAPPGAHVTAIIHTIPLFNGILCVRLGELTVNLNECELVRATDAGNVATRNWFAWNDRMPPRPDVFHVTGEVQVPNPGVHVVLVPREPQGINPAILLLDLHLVPGGGVSPQIVVWKQASYEKVNASYSSAQIFYGDNVIANVPAIDVQ